MSDVPDATKWVDKLRGDEPNMDVVEPVAWFQVEQDANGTNRYIQVSETDLEFYVPLYAAPLKREWVSLTDDDMEAMFLNEDGVRIARYIESKLEELNT